MYHNNTDFSIVKYSISLFSALFSAARNGPLRWSCRLPLSLSCPSLYHIAASCSVGTVERAEVRARPVVRADGIVRAENAAYLKSIFPQASVTMVPGSEHALPIVIPEKIDAAVSAVLRENVKSAV